jgi:ABC-type glycerol-3-phosphate transport system permease component
MSDSLLLHRAARTEQTRGRRAPRRPIGGSLRVVVAVLLALVFAFPIVWTTLGAFKPAQDANASPPVWWPSAWSLENFSKLDSSGASLSSYVAHSAWSR